MDADPREPFVACLDRLYAAYGREELPPDGDLLATLLRAMLAQATSRANSAQAYRQLVDACGGDWDALRDVSPDEVAALIAVGGLSRQKAPRLLAVLDRVRADFGRCSLESLRAWEPERARAYLTSLDGVGPKTAAFTLMRAAGMDVFPLNGGILRVLRRLGVLGGGESDEAAHRRMAELVPRGDSHVAHVALVRHARETCTSQRPRCAGCPLEALCPQAP